MNMTPSDLASSNSTVLGVPIVDAHCHVIADDVNAFPLAPMGGKQSDWSRERPVSGEGMVAAMHAGGIAKSILVQASTCYGHDNSYVAASVQALPQRFVGVYSVDAMSADAIERIEHWRKAGLSGLRVFIAGHTAADHSVRLDDPRGFPAWKYVTEQKIPVCVQLRADGLVQLETLLRWFPTATVVLDHFARPALEDGAPYQQAASLFALARFPNLHFKFTTHNVRESKLGKSTQSDFCRAVVDAFGAQRIAWGSNFPASSGSLLQLLNEALQATAFLTLEQQRWIFSRTAHQLYPDLNRLAA